MTAPGDPQTTAKTEEHAARCSFCGKGPETVGELIDGRDVKASICRDCAELCVKIFEHQSWRRCAEREHARRPFYAAMRELVQAKIDQSLSDLSPVEREVIKLRYGLSMGYIYSYEELAQRLEITPAGVVEAEREAVEKLRSPKA
jgi:RNA polymerase sigma factor (sigma-70 family)